MRTSQIKKIIASVALGCFFLTATPAFAIDVVVNDQTLDYSSDQPPVIQNSRTLVPLRSIFEALGATVDWDDATRTVTAQKDGTIITLTIDSTLATINGVGISLDVPAQIMNSRTMVPVRFVAESLGAQVDWLSANQTVYINSTVPALTDLFQGYWIGHFYGMQDNQVAFTSLLCITQESDDIFFVLEESNGSTTAYPSYHATLLEYRNDMLCETTTGIVLYYNYSSAGWDVYGQDTANNDLQRALKLCFPTMPAGDFQLESSAPVIDPACYYSLVDGKLVKKIDSSLASASADYVNSYLYPNTYLGQSNPTEGNTYSKTQY